MSVSPYADKDLQIRAAILQDMRARWQPHRGQVPVRVALRDPFCVYVFLQCGRKFGKTDLLLNEAVENCLLPRNDGELSYYFGPEADQVEEIAWLENRALKMCDSTLVHKVYDQDMRIVYKNGRQLIHGGSNNFQAAAGKRPSFLALDEFKDFKPKFWDVMEPNLSVYNAQCVIAGSPPDGPCQYIEIADMVKDMQEEGTGFFTRQPTWMNDKIPGLIPWLAAARKRYEKRGELAVFDREYGALYVPGGKRAIFPQFDWITVVKSRKWLLENVKKNAHRFNFYCIADPATESVFSVVFAAINPDTRDIYILDVIYEKDRLKTSAKKIWEDQIKPTCEKWNADEDEWTFAYDDHEAWFQVESLNVPGAPNWIPAGKFAMKKTSSISSLKTAMECRKFWVNVECDPLKFEFANYSTGADGKIPKGNDHTIDCCRYLLIVSAWDTQQAVITEIPEHIRNDPWLLRAIASEEEIITEDLMEDWTHDMFNDWAEMGSMYG